MDIVLSDSKVVKIRFTIEILEGCDCMGGSFSDCCDFEVNFTDEEVELMKRLVAASEPDSETNLMPILEDQAPELFHRIDEKARVAITEFFWLEAAHAGDGGVDTDYGDLFLENYQRDLEVVILCHRTTTNRKMITMKTRIWHISNGMKENRNV